MAGADIRKWTDPKGIEWKIWLRELKGSAPGAARLYFTPDPKDSMEAPKLLVRGLSHVYQIPERSLPFILRAAKAGGFVWRDSDGAAWHISVTAHVRAENGRQLRVHHSESHRALWRMEDEELEGLVGKAVHSVAEPDRALR